MAIDREFSATRSHAGFKPRVCEDDIPFYECPSCGHVHIGVTDGEPIAWSGSGSTKIAELPFVRTEAPTCTACGVKMEPIPFVEHEDVPEDFELDFQFRGGFNANCVKIKWFAKMGCKLHIDWACVKTFTGFQVKYVHEKKYSPLTFAFADEDAYCYCDSDPCEECMFRCKNGMIGYVHVVGLGLVRMSFDRMLASGSGPSNEGLRRTRK